MEPKIYISSIEKWIPEGASICKEFCDSEDNFCVNLDDYDLTKPGILIIDDNPGAVSFLMDDLETLEEDGFIDLTKVNVFLFTSKTAAYKLFSTIRKYGDLNIQVSIIDITLGGVSTTLNRIIKLTGIDVLEVLLEMNPDMDYLFYTGNQMNPYIKPIDKIMKQYKALTGKNIEDKIVFKTSMSLEQRQAYLYKNLLSSIFRANTNKVT